MELSRREFIRMTAAATAATILAEVPGVEHPVAAKESLATLDALSQAERVQRGDITAVELLDAAIARIEAVNPQINAVVTRAYDLARERTASGGIEGPFKGVPFLVKDLNDVKGVRTTSGSRMHLDRIARAHHPYVRACVQAGLNVCGKSNTPEHGLQATTESLALGPCYNPWDLRHSAGGSSGGAAAAVASGMVPLAHANDGGGSIRIPASCCGVFGLMASRGRVIGSTNRFSLAVQGGVSRSVQDSAHLLAHTERKTPAPHLKPVGVVDRPNKKRLRIALAFEGLQGETPDTDVQKAIETTAALCEELGHEVVEHKLDIDGPRVVRDFLTLWSSTAGEVAAAFEEETGRPPNHQELEPLTLAFAKEFLEGGQARMGEAVQYLMGLDKVVSNQLQDFDVRLSPVLRSAPPVIGEQGPTVPYDTLIDRMVSYVSYTPLFNVTGMPAMSVPLFWNDAGLPIGSQFAAKAGDERTLLELAYELEEARPWAGNWAPNAAPR